MGDNVAQLVRLMLVTDDRLVRGRDLVSLAQAAERGGVTSVQLRLKEATARELAQLVRELVQALRIPVLVNDRPDVAIAAGAAGVHLGPDDMPIGLARRIAPPGFVLGASVGSETEAAAAGGADYWGIGPWRATADQEERRHRAGRRWLQPSLPAGRGHAGPGHWRGDAGGRPGRPGGRGRGSPSCRGYWGRRMWRERRDGMEAGQRVSGSGQ